jgi:hypothetical protein
VLRPEQLQEALASSLATLLGAARSSSSSSSSSSAKVVMLPLATGSAAARGMCNAAQAVRMAQVASADSRQQLEVSSGICVTLQGACQLLAAAQYEVSAQCCCCCSGCSSSVICSARHTYSGWYDKSIAPLAKKYFCPSTTAAAVAALCSLQVLVKAALPQWSQRKGWGLLLLLYSLLLTRGCSMVAGDMDEAGTSLVDEIGYCSMELVNLMLTGGGKYTAVHVCLTCSDVRHVRSDPITLCRARRCGLAPAQHGAVSWKCCHKKQRSSCSC